MTDILNYTKSEEIFSAAQQLMPGGVSSPVRAFKSVGGQPIVFDRVKGPFAWDIDGNRYICLLYTSPSPRDKRQSRMPSSA